MIIQKIENELLPILCEDFPNTRFAISKWKFEEDGDVVLLYKHDDLDNDTKFSFEKWEKREAKMMARLNELLPIWERIQFIFMEDVLNEI